MGGWILIECMYRDVLFYFLKGKYFPAFKLKDASTKYVSMRFVSIVLNSPSSLNKLTMSFLNLSSFGSLALRTIASPSPLWKHTLLKPKRGLILFRRYNPTSSHTCALSSCPLRHWITSSDLFLPQLHYHQITKFSLQGV